jgi:CheY-like chemotaxis protein
MTLSKEPCAPLREHGSLLIKLEARDNQLYCGISTLFNPTASDGAAGMQIFQDPQLEQALVSLSRLIKAASYYPEAHPAVNRAVDETTQKLNRCAAQSSKGVIALQIKRQGFLQEDIWLSPENKVLAQLAQRFFQHKIKNLVIFEHMREQHLQTLIHCLTLEPQQLEARGGAVHDLERAQVTSILLNQIDLSAIGSSQRKHPSDDPLQEEDHSIRAVQNGSSKSSKEQTAEADRTERNKTLKLMLQEAQCMIERGSEEKLPEFKRCLDKIRHRLDSILTTPQHQPDALQVIVVLDSWIHAGSYPQSFVAVSMQCLSKLDPGRTVAMLLDAACNNSRRRNLALRTIKLLGSESCAIVWEQLIVEPNPKARRFLTSVMAALGSAADRIMLEHLEDSRWYVVRNALNILGSRRNPEYIGAFKAQLIHRETRVAKEALAALAAIRHEHAANVVLEYLSMPNCPLPELAILALGAQQDPRAIPLLSRIAQRNDRLLKQKKIRLKAIEALGQIRNADANPALVAIIKKGKIIKRSEYLELRLAALNALGKTAGKQERELLQHMSASHDPSIAKGARQALQTGQRE